VPDSQSARKVSISASSAASPRPRRIWAWWSAPFCGGGSGFNAPDEPVEERGPLGLPVIVGVVALADVGDLLQRPPRARTQPGEWALASRSPATRPRCTPWSGRNSVRRRGRACRSGRETAREKAQSVRGLRGAWSRLACPAARPGRCLWTSPAIRYTARIPPSSCSPGRRRSCPGNRCCSGTREPPPRRGRWWWPGPMSQVRAPGFPAVLPSSPI